MRACNLKAGYRSITGNYRKNNEDRVYVDPVLGLFLVADGMGGQLAGEQASQMAVDIISQQVEEGIKSATREDHSVGEVIRLSMLNANQEIMASASLHAEFQSMGTTCVLALVCEKSVYVAAVGDSRAYLSRSGSLNQLTTDHSLAQALVEAGTISSEDAQKHRFRNILWKYLGSKEVGNGPDVLVIDVLPGDRWMLTSDGLTGVLSDSEMLRTLAEQPDPQAAAESLVQQALDSDSHDNVSCITIYLD